MSRSSKEKISAWANHIGAQRDSGLTQQAYCKEYALKSHQFWYWKRKLEGVKKKNPKQAGMPGFIPVKVAEQHNARGLSITLPSGITLNGIDSGNLCLAQQLIGTLA